MNERDQRHILGYEVHPACAMLPLMSEDSLDELATDIRQRGLNSPIILHAGKLLDGRNRLLACEKAGVAPEFEQFEGDDPIAWVLSHNFHRRHLSDTQKALVGAKAEQLLLARAVMSGDGDGASDRDNGTEPEETQSPSGSQTPPPAAPKVVKEVRRTAAALVNVSERAIAKGKKLIDRAVPELVAAVEVGTVPMTVASTVAELDPPTQRQVVAEGPVMIKAQARRMREEKKALRPPSITAAFKLLDERCPDYVIEKTREGRFVFKATVFVDGDERVVETEAFALRDLLIQAVKDAPAL